jgi:hypothetical protein
MALSRGGYLFKYYNITDLVTGPETGHLAGFPPEFDSISDCEQLLLADFGGLH